MGKWLRENLYRQRSRLITLALLAMIAYLWFRPLAFVSDEARPLPQMSFTLFDGRTLDLSDLRGKVVLVNVWATWCVYCRKEMPAIDEFYRDHRDRGFEVIALSQDDDAALAAKYLKERGVSFSGAMMQPEHHAGLGKVTRLPTSFVIDGEGRVRHQVTGQVFYGRLEDLVAPLLPSAARP